MLSDCGLQRCNKMASKYCDKRNAKQSELQTKCPHQNQYSLAGKSLSSTEILHGALHKTTVGE